MTFYIFDHNMKMLRSTNSGEPFFTINGDKIPLHSHLKVYKPYGEYIVVVLESCGLKGWGLARALAKGVK